ncbi:MAG TPA: phosphoribosyltransferase family protein [Candidatus Nanoarchaeia archaeon]|nr:phosphoribosyltransferase family protein [Candidatus Nanoarchaeia archaeon]
MDQKALEKGLLKIKSEISDYLIPSNAKIYQKTIDELIRPFKGSGINKVVAIDMKGLMYGPIIASKLRVAFVPILKGGKIKNRQKALVKDFIDYSGKKKSIEMFKSSIEKGDKVLLVDDWFDSGNTGKAAITLIEHLGGKVKGISVIFNQLNEKQERFFKSYNYHFIVRLKPKDSK